MRRRARQPRSAGEQEHSRQGEHAGATPEADAPAQAYRLAVLTDSEGACPFDRWLASLRDQSARARLLLRLLRAEGGNLGDHRERIAGPVSELKLDYGPGYRVYYVLHGRMLIILLGGGTKASQPDDVAAAVGFWERNKDHAERLSREFRGGPG